MALNLSNCFQPCSSNLLPFAVFFETTALYAIRSLFLVPKVPRHSFLTTSSAIPRPQKQRQWNGNFKARRLGGVQYWMSAMINLQYFGCMWQHNFYTNNHEMLVLSRYENWAMASWVCSPWISKKGNLNSSCHEWMEWLQYINGDSFFLRARVSS